MSPVLLVAALFVVAAAIACVSARSAAAVAVGAALLLGVTPFLADPVPAPLLLLERAVGAALAAEFLWVGLRGRPVSAASALGWLPLALLAAAAFVAGVGAQRLLATGVASVGPDGSVVSGSAGSPEAFGAALALAAVALTAVARRSDGVGLGLSGLVLVAATSVLRVALAGAPTALETLLVAGLGLAIAAAVALVVPQVEITVRPTGPAALPVDDDGEDSALERRLAARSRVRERR